MKPRMRWAGIAAAAALEAAVILGIFIAVAIVATH